MRIIAIVTLGILVVGLQGALSEAEIADGVLPEEAAAPAALLDVNAAVEGPMLNFALAVPLQPLDAVGPRDYGTDTPQAASPVGQEKKNGEPTSSNKGELKGTNATPAGDGAGTATGGDKSGSTGTGGEGSGANKEADNSLDTLCTEVRTSAEQNGLPVAFFANLIWQESRLQRDSVSHAGALGIAQFMPEVAVEVGLHDPFDPRQAIPASARLLRTLRAHFGNLGFAAAAYNAGAHRVMEWLDRRRRLPRETRTYVMRVTGRSAEAWRKSRVKDSQLTFAGPLPCRKLPAYADLEEAQAAVQQPQHTGERETHSERPEQRARHATEKSGRGLLRSAVHRVFHAAHQLAQRQHVRFIHTVARAAIRPGVTARRGRSMHEPRDLAHRRSQRERRRVAEEAAAIQEN
jgi:hypothetical protein